MQNFFGMDRKRLKRQARWIIIGLPLAGILVADLFPLKRWEHQFLVAAVLIWFQVFILSEVFFPGIDQ